MQELRDLLSEKRNSELVDMLRFIRSLNWRGRVVTEIPAVVLHSLRSERGRFASIKDLIEDHKQIVNTIQTVFS